MAPSSEAFALAVQHHRAGRLQAAEQIYREILQADPNQADALHLLGVIGLQIGQNEAAARNIQRAIALKPALAYFHAMVLLDLEYARQPHATVALGGMRRLQASLTERLGLSKIAEWLFPSFIRYALRSWHKREGNWLVLCKPAGYHEIFKSALSSLAPYLHEEQKGKGAKPDVILCGSELRVALFIGWNGGTCDCG